LKKYEGVFIIDVRKVDDEGKALTEELKSFIESSGGKMIETIEMGRKQFAREINKRKAGIYWNYVFELTPDKVIEIKERYRLNDKVIRIMIINYERPENYTPAEKIEI
jgi:small subunit ribosomal protein S6